MSWNMENGNEIFNVNKSDKLGLIFCGFFGIFCMEYDEIFRWIWFVKYRGGGKYERVSYIVDVLV